MNKVISTEKKENGKHVLLILASGKSSRFGGFPKAFCKIGNTYVAQRTVDMASAFYHDIYLVINREIYPEFKDAVAGCKVLSIGTGQGDSHSFLRAIRLIKADCDAKKITLCWGDTFYLNDQIFRKAHESMLADTDVGISLCSMDKKPYAWFETEREYIKASHFKSKDGEISEGVHDQSVFVFNTDIICSQLEMYMKTLGINDEEDYINREVSKEMKLLDSFTYFYEKGLNPMRYTLVETGTCYSFNTNEELEIIRNRDSLINTL